MHNALYIIVLPFGQWRPCRRYERGTACPPATLTAFACRRLRLYRPSGSNAAFGGVVTTASPPLTACETALCRLRWRLWLMAHGLKSRRRRDAVMPPSVALMADGSWLIEPPMIWTLSPPCKRQVCYYCIVRRVLSINLTYRTTNEICNPAFIFCHDAVRTGDT